MNDAVAWTKQSGVRDCPLGRDQHTEGPPDSTAFHPGYSVIFQYVTTFYLPLSASGAGGARFSWFGKLSLRLEPQAGAGPGRFVSWPALPARYKTKE